MTCITGLDWSSGRNFGSTVNLSYRTLVVSHMVLSNNGNCLKIVCNNEVWEWVPSGFTCQCVFSFGSLSCKGLNRFVLDWSSNNSSMWPRITLKNTETKIAKLTQWIWVDKHDNAAMPHCAPALAGNTMEGAELLQHVRLSLRYPAIFSHYTTKLVARSVVFATRVWAQCSIALL